jgi:hypothetical protein
MKVRAGRHARRTTRRLARRALTGIAALVVGGLLVGLVAGYRSWPFIAAEAAIIAGLLLIDRLGLPIIERRDRGATGEEHVGLILDGLGDAGWHAIHDVYTGRGNIDHIVVGPGGVVTVETKSHGGRINVEHIDARMLRQPYAQAKHLERLLGTTVAPLLVFSRAYLVGRPVSRQRGVLVLPARMLAEHLARRPARLSPAQVAELHIHALAVLERAA